MKHAPLTSPPRNRPARPGGTTRAAALLGAAASTLLLTACSPGSEEDPSPSTATSEPAPSAAAEAAPSETSDAQATNRGTPITITAGNQTFRATLNNSQVSQDFIKTLPVTLPWLRNAGIEYITELDAPLTETGPFYTDVQPGDLVYYNPLDSITIIYEETSSVPTLTKMGEITGDLSAVRDLPDDVDLRVELG